MIAPAELLAVETSVLLQSWSDPLLWGVMLAGALLSRRQVWLLAWASLYAVLAGVAQVVWIWHGAPEDLLTLPQAMAALGRVMSAAIAGLALWFIVDIFRRRRARAR